MKQPTKHNGKPISHDFEIALNILQWQDKEDRTYFGRLVEEFDGFISKLSVSKYIDRLFDYGIIDGDWEMKKDGKWYRVFFVDEDAYGLIKGLEAVAEEVDE